MNNYAYGCCCIYFGCERQTCEESNIKNQHMYLTVFSLLDGITMNILYVISYIK
jgi:hypothetical protein